jgi:hypothetical protein
MPLRELAGLVLSRIVRADSLKLRTRQDLGGYGNLAAQDQQCGEDTCTINALARIASSPDWYRQLSV